MVIILAREGKLGLLTEKAYFKVDTAIQDKIIHLPLATNIRYYVTRYIRK